MAAALVVGTATSAGSGTAYVSGWIAATGLGLGLALPTAMNAALGALTAERSGSGSALMSAMRQVGATIGVAVLGTVLNTVYQGRLHLPGLPAAAVRAARSSVAGGLAVAHASGSAALLGDVRSAYASGLDVMLWVCAGIAIAAAAARRAVPAAAHAEVTELAAPGAEPAEPGIPRPRGQNRAHEQPRRGRAGPARPVGLRERKKARTRAAIREHALRLFREQGYAVTTIEQIAAAAEVSPATFFRYFPTKEDVVLQDDFDVITIEALNAQPPELSPVAAFRAAAQASLAVMTDEDKERFRETRG